MDKKSLSIKIGIPVVVTFVIIMLLIIGKVIDSDQFQQRQEYPITKPYIEISPLNGEQVLVGDVVAEWLKGETNGEELYNQYSTVGRVYSAKSVMIYYAIYNIPANIEVENQLVELSESNSFDEVKKFELSGNKRSVRFDYLMTDRIYYYRITANLSNGLKISANGQFKTADTPRLIGVEGVWNMRDIGGVKTAYGKTTKEGLIYRGVELDGAVYEKYCITEEAAKILTEQLGIKTETDLRSESDNMRDMLGPNVKHTFYGVYAYTDSLVKYYKESYRQLFSDLAKEENYPMYVHCTYGKDRTGTVCYLLQLLLGVSEEDAYKEWEISVLLDGKVDYSSMEAYRKALKEIKGDTMQDKAKNLLLSFGVTKKEIESIRTILIEDYVSND